MVEVNPGSQYSLGEIYFRRTAAFPSQQLRNLFSMRRGDLFNGSKFGEGLGNLQKLYASRGCINMVAAPGVRIDESKHILDIFLDVDEGQVETGQTGRR
jgi:outer membrane protein assembly factor BamA